eukprot:scaffold115015_cov65-Phaeocystis_antarctica.AAC.2
MIVAVMITLAAATVMTVDEGATPRLAAIEFWRAREHDRLRGVRGRAAAARRRRRCRRRRRRWCRRCGRRRCRRCGRRCRRRRCRRCGRRRCRRCGQTLTAVHRGKRVRVELGATWVSRGADVVPLGRAAVPSIEPQLADGVIGELGAVCGSLAEHWRGRRAGHHRVGPCHVPGARGPAPIRRARHDLIVALKRAAPRRSPRIIGPVADRGRRRGWRRRRRQRRRRRGARGRAFDFDAARLPGAGSAVIVLPRVTRSLRAVRVAAARVVQPCNGRRVVGPREPASGGREVQVGPDRV